MRKPNFFIVGAPKSGTSSMYNYLRQHPEVFMSPLKEPHYFGDDHHHINRAPRTLERYLEHFTDAEDEKRIGEASTSYLHSKCAPREIKEFNPSARIIIMLRNPIEVMYALYHENRIGGFEFIQDFEDALDAEKKRKERMLWPDKPGIVDTLFYRDIVRYTEQIHRYLNTFGSEKVKVIIFDDFTQRTETIYRETLEFLDVNPSFEPAFEIANRSRQIRNNFFHRIVSNPPQIIQRVVGSLLPPDTRVRLSHTLLRLNSKSEPRPAMDAELRRRLEKEFVPEVKRLSELLDRDLMHWVHVQEA